jgi:hypothetical protein
MQEDQVKITFSGAMSLERSVSFKRATSIARLLAEPENINLQEITTDDLSLPSNTSPSSGRVPGSALEAIKKAGPRTFPQRIVTLADFITKRDKIDHFDSKDVQTLLRRLGMPPQNFGRDMRQAEHVFAYVAKEADGQYIVTETGREAVEKGFGNTEGSTTYKKRKIKRSKKVSKE